MLDCDAGSGLRGPVKKASSPTMLSTNVLRLVHEAQDRCVLVIASSAVDATNIELSCGLNGPSELVPDWHCASHVMR